jgi:ABC-type transport system substrate-binding protein
MNEAVFGGAGDPIDTLFPKGSPYYQPSIKQLEPDDKKAQDLSNELAAAGKPVNFTLNSVNTTGHVQMGAVAPDQPATFTTVTMKLEPLATQAADRLIPGTSAMDAAIQKGLTATSLQARVAAAKDMQTKLVSRSRMSRSFRNPRAMIVA